MGTQKPRVRRQRPKREPPAPGTIIAGRYTTGRVLGRGGFGVVVEGTQINLDRKVAIKVIWKDISESETNCARFLNEAQIYARVDSPYVVKVHDCGKMDDGRLFLVMEYLEGENLHEFIERQGTLSTDQVRGITMQMLRGLAGAHEAGIVHRDIKPRNIMITRDDDGRQFVKVLDFGLSDVGEVEEDGYEDDNALARGLTLSGKVCGTPMYMSPEQITARDVDPRSDIYAVGITMFEMCTGTVPFHGPDIASYTAQHMREPPPWLSAAAPESSYPKRLEDIVRTCLAKRPHDRYRSAHSAMADLDELEDELASARLAPTWEPGAGSQLTSEVTADADVEKSAEPHVIASVGRALQQLARAYKCLQLYPANSPHVVEAIEGAQNLLSPPLETRAWIGLALERTKAFFLGETVYEDDDLRDSLPFRLFDDGIRRLYFDAGIQADELREFLTCLLEAANDGGHHEDLVTLLWERALKHVRIVLVEDLVEEGGPGLEVIEEDVMYKSAGEAEGGKRKPRAGGGGIGLGCESVTERYLQPVDGEKRHQLHCLLQEFEKTDPIKQFLKSLSGMLNLNGDPAEVVGVVRLFGHISRMLLRAGTITLAVKILLILDQVRQAGADAEILAAVSDSIRSTGEAKLVEKALEAMCHDGNDRIRRQVGTYLVLVGPRAVVPVLQAMSDLDEKALAIIQVFLLKVARKHPVALQPGLASDDPRVAHAVIRVLGELGGAEIVRLLRPMVEHPSGETREKALAALVKIAPDELAEIVEPCLRDESADVRVLAIRACRKMSAEDGRRMLLVILRGGVPYRAQVEQITLMKVLATMPDPVVIAEIARQLEPEEKGWKDSLLAASSRGLRRVGVSLDLGDEDPMITQYKGNLVRCLKRMKTPAADAVVARHQGGSR